MAANFNRMQLQDPIPYGRFQNEEEQEKYNISEVKKKICSKKILIGFSIGIIACLIIGAIISSALGAGTEDGAVVPVRHIDRGDSLRRKCEIPFKIHRFQMNINSTRAPSSGKITYTNIYEQDQMGDSLLLWAASLGELGCVKAIHEQDMKDRNTLINQEGQGGRTPLIDAAESGHLEVVEYLLNNGANITARTNKESSDPGSNALIQACKEGNFQIIKLLLERGANLTDTTDENMDCAYYTAMKGHLQTLIYLLNLDSYAPEQRRIEAMALLGAAEAGNLVEVEYLLGDGTSEGKEIEAFYNTQLARKTTPLITSCAANHSLLTYYLIERMPFFGGREKDVFGMECADYAIENHNLGILKELTNHGQNFWQGSEGKGFLLKAVKTNQTDIVEFLIHNGADVDEKSSFGNTPLIIAAYSGNLEIVRLLANQGATLDTKFENKTAADWAKNNNFKEVYCWLLLKEHDIKIEQAPDSDISPELSENIKECRHHKFIRSVKQLREWRKGINI